MQSTATNLALDEVTLLRGDNRRLREAVAQLELDNRNLEAVLRFLRGQRFAPQSERFVGLTALFGEPSEPEEALEPDEPQKPKKPRKKKRKTIPDDLPRKVREHDIPDSEKTCPHHQVPLERGADRVSEKVEWIPAKIEVIEDRCATYACPICDGVVKAAEAPLSPIPGSIATPSLLAHIATLKYADGLPLYRQEKILERSGLYLTRTTMATWMGRLGTLLAPLVNLFQDVLVLGRVIYVDETHHQVLAVPGKAPTSKSFMWVRVGGIDGQKVVLFHFDPSKGADVAKSLLKDYKGFVTTDGYEAYNFLAGTDGVVRVQCWMHARRYFDKALKALGKAGKGGIAAQAMMKIRELYAIERECEAMSAADRQRVRQEKSKPLLDAFHDWLQVAQNDLPPKSATGKAINYTLERWTDLTVYVQDGELRMDNAPAENAIRPFAVGRNSWLFSDSVEGAEAMAVLYSIVETAKANGLDPNAYMRRVLEALPKARTVEDVDALLPWARPQAPPS